MKTFLFSKNPENVLQFTKGVTVHVFVPKIFNMGLLVRYAIKYSFFFFSGNLNNKRHFDNRGASQ